MTNDVERVSDIPRPVAYIVHEPTKFGGDHSFCDESDYATKVEAMIAGVRLTPLYTADIIEAQSKALEEARVVRPLEWLEHANNERAETMLGEYVVWQSGETQSFLRFCGVTKEIFGPLSLAKAAAQADYAARILSALKGDGDK